MDWVFGFRRGEIYWPTWVFWKIKIMREWGFKVVITDLYRMIQ